ncbi:MAG: DUF4926 domain-containing protein [Chloroflexota bacterium]|nr:DUF4926 domain-containing protein [Chloroflexota bacterium]
MINEHERAVLTVDLPDYDFRAGDVGVVVHIYADAQAYEVEFFTLAGNTLDVVTVEATQVRPVNRRDMLHVRALPEAV